MFWYSECWLDKPYTWRLYTFVSGPLVSGSRNLWKIRCAKFKRLQLLNVSYIFNQPLGKYKYLWNKMCFFNFGKLPSMPQNIQNYKLVKSVELSWYTLKKYHLIPPCWAPCSLTVSSPVVGLSPTLPHIQQQY